VEEGFREKSQRKKMLSYSAVGEMCRGKGGVFLAWCWD